MHKSVKILKKRARGNTVLPVAVAVGVFALFLAAVVQVVDRSGDGSREKVKVADLAHDPQAQARLLLNLQMCLSEVEGHPVRVRDITDGRGTHAKNTRVYQVEGDTTIFYLAPPNVDGGSNVGARVDAEASRKKIDAVNRRQRSMEWCADATLTK